MMIHTICVKLQVLVNATPEFEDLNLKFKIQNKKPLIMSEHPMHRLESSLKFY